MSIRITEIPGYENYGRCLKLENDKAELIVTLDVGPRILSYRLQGHENMLFNDLNRDCVEKGADFDKCFCPGAAWYAYGGHRLWASPEIYPSTYYPENAPVAYEVSGDTVLLTPPEQAYTHFQLRTWITMDCCTAKVTLRHSIQNMYLKPITVSPWAITQVAPGGVEIVPMPDRPSGYLANRVLALWDYTDMSDPRVCWGKKYITLKQDVNALTPFKIGINAEQGWAAYINRGQAFIKRFDFDPKLTYPDYNVKYETYTCDKFTELETVGELKALEPGESVELEERWELMEQESFCTCDVAALDAFAAKING